MPDGWSESLPIKIILFKHFGFMGVGVIVLKQWFKAGTDSLRWPLRDSFCHAWEAEVRGYLSAQGSEILLACSFAPLFYIFIAYADLGPA